MEKEFVPYELGVKLKELGFNEKCIAYHKDNEIYQEAGVCYVNSDFEPTMVWDEMLPNKNCTAPLWRQAFRWFRERHGLQGYVYSTTVRGGKEGKHFSDYCWHINGIDMPFLSTDARDMENVSYEEAELACLTKLIEIVESKSE